jgi:hypothetical protein
MTASLIPEVMRALPPLQWHESMVDAVQSYAQQELRNLYPPRSRRDRDRRIPPEAIQAAVVSKRTKIVREAIFTRIDMNLLNPLRLAYSPQVDFETVASDILRPLTFINDGAAEAERKSLLETLEKEWKKEVAEFNRRFTTAG